MPTIAVGGLIREWRTRRGRSQLDLSLDVGVSTRHLSFVETGRSRPSPELVLALAEHLEVPLRERNGMLLAAGYAPRYGHTPLDAPAMRRITASLQRLLDAHDPYPGVVIDRTWNIVLANASAAGLMAGLPEELLRSPINVFRISLHPDGLAARTLNFADWARYLLRQLERVRVGGGEVAALYDEVTAYPGLPVDPLDPAVDERDDPPLLVPFRLDVGDGRSLSLFTTLTTFGTPQDVTLEELAVELFFPADDESEALLRAPA